MTVNDSFFVYCGLTPMFSPWEASEKGETNSFLRTWMLTHIPALLRFGVSCFKSRSSSASTESCTGLCCTIRLEWKKDWGKGEWTNLLLSALKASTPCSLCVTCCCSPLGDRSSALGNTIPSDTRSFNMGTQTCTMVKPRGTWCICCFTGLCTMGLCKLSQTREKGRQRKAEHKVLCEEWGPSHPMEGEAFLRLLWLALVFQWWPSSRISTQSSDPVWSGWNCPEQEDNTASPPSSPREMEQWRARATTALCPPLHAQGTEKGEGLAAPSDPGKADFSCVYLHICRVQAFVQPATSSAYPICCHSIPCKYGIYPA